MTDENETSGRDPIEWPLVHKLAKPVEAHGETVGSFQLREPTAGDLLKHGFLDGSAGGNEMVALIAELAKVPPSSVKALSARDILKLSRAITDFLSQAAR